MKNAFKTLGVVAVIAVMSFSFLACPPAPAGDAIASELHGTWARDNDPANTIKFTASSITGTGIDASPWNAENSMGAEFRASNGKIEVTYMGLGFWQTTFTYTITGNQLTLKSGGLTHGVYTKQNVYL